MVSVLTSPWSAVVKEAVSLNQSQISQLRVKLISQLYQQDQDTLFSNFHISATAASVSDSDWPTPVSQSEFLCRKSNGSRNSRISSSSSSSIKMVSDQIKLFLVLLISSLAVTEEVCTDILLTINLWDDFYLKRLVKILKSENRFILCIMSSADWTSSCAHDWQIYFSGGTFKSNTNLEEMRKMFEIWSEM